MRGARGGRRRGENCSIARVCDRTEQCLDLFCIQVLDRLRPFSHETATKTNR
jgi:hypothetical protein